MHIVSLYELLPLRHGATRAKLEQWKMKSQKIFFQNMKEKSMRNTMYQITGVFHPGNNAVFFV
jgi:hypothetical protein